MLKSSLFNDVKDIFSLSWEIHLEKKLIVNNVFYQIYSHSYLIGSWVRY